MATRPDLLFTHLLIDLANHLPPKGAEGAPDLTYRQFASQRLMENVLKKYVDHTEPEAESRAVEKWKSSNQRCQEWELRLANDKEEQLWGMFKDSLYRFWYSGKALLDGVIHYSMPLIASLGDLYEGFDLGPGSTVLSRGTSFYQKLFTGRASVYTEVAKRRFHHFLRYHHVWGEAFRQVRSEYGEPVMVAGSSQSCVPKKVDIARTIASEATVETLFQKGIQKRLEDGLDRHWGINLTVQPFLNRALARVGSETNQLVTLDLREASNSIATKMIRAAAPPSMTAVLMDYRSTFTQLEDGSLVVNHMLASMGNSFIFPLQTVLFTCVVEAVSRFHSVKMERPYWAPNGDLLTLGNWGVFGDDIICDVRLADDVVRLLSILGFEINPSKSFTNGPFRESCGGDWFRGQSATPVYIRTLATPQDLVVAANGLVDWTMRTSIPLPSTCRWLLEEARRFGFVPEVPPYFPQSSGLRTPYRFVDKRKLRKGPLESMLFEYWAPVLPTVRLRNEEWLADGWTNRLFKGRLAGMGYNPSGAYLCVLRGDLKDVEFSRCEVSDPALRNKANNKDSHPVHVMGLRLPPKVPIRYRRTRAIVPNWDDDTAHFSGSRVPFLLFADPKLPLEAAYVVNAWVPE